MFKDYIFLNVAFIVAYFLYFCLTVDLYMIFLYFYLLAIDIYFLYKIEKIKGGFK